MTTELIDQETELKEAVLRKLVRIHDLDGLRKLVHQADALTDDEAYVLSPEEETWIAAAEKRLDAGVGVPETERRTRTRECLGRFEKNSR